VSRLPTASAELPIRVVDTGTRIGQSASVVTKEGDAPRMPVMSTEMRRAIVEDDLDVLRALVARGESPDAVLDAPLPYRWSALMLCAEHDRLRLLQLLLSAGADPNYALADGWTALHHAVDSEWDAESNGVAVADGHLVRALVAAGADPDAVCSRLRESPRDMARYSTTLVAALG